MVDIAFVADDARIGYPAMRGMTAPDTLYFPWKMSMARAKYLQLTGNSATGKETAEIGWVAKSFPATELGDQVMRELRPMPQICSRPTNRLSIRPMRSWASGLLWRKAGCGMCCRRAYGPMQTDFVTRCKTAD